MLELTFRLDNVSDGFKTGCTIRFEVVDISPADETRTLVVYRFGKGENGVEIDRIFKVMFVWCFTLSIEDCLLNDFMFSRYYTHEASVKGNDHNLRESEQSAWELQKRIHVSFVVQNKRIGGNRSVKVTTMEAIDSSRKEPEMELYTVPAHSSWFLWDDIHDIERREFEEFFSESSITRTPKVYKEYRDFIINKFRENTSRRLTFTSIRKFLVGDVNLLQKVFIFLENWGLINFGSSLKKSDDVLLVESTGKFNVKVEEGNPAGIRVTATPNSLRPVAAPPLVVERAVSGIKLAPLTSYSDVFSDSKKPLICGHCGDRCCDSAFYEHKKSIVKICEKCFKNGDYGENNSADDFKLIGNSSAVADWTEEEILLLLESVLKHGDDWELIAQSVSTKSRLDCISKLIELPFGEFLMSSASGRLTSSIPTEEENGGHRSPSHPEQMKKTDGQEIITGEEKEDRADEDEPLAKRKCVELISDGDSSLMKQVAAMASKFGPAVATAAAKAAIAALCDEASCPKEIFENGDFTNSAVDRDDGDKDTDMEEPQEDKDGAQDLPGALRIRASVGTALGAAAAHAKILADQEEREMELLAATILDQQLKKVKSKLKFMDQLESIMDAEEKVIDGVKETILQERVSVLQCAFRDGVTKRWDHNYVK